jgi:hypothetical protein
VRRTLLLLFLLVSVARAQDSSEQRFQDHIFKTRYHAGDQILVEDPGSGGTYSPRAEIEAVLPDGRYKVRLWDKPIALDHPRIFAHPDALTGQVPENEALTRVRRTRADGSTYEETSRTPWLLRDREREVTLTHDEIDRLNGVVMPEGAYDVNGWLIDPAKDPILKSRIAGAEKALEEILPKEMRALPEDAAQAAAKLEEIAKRQVELLDRIFKENLIDHPLHLTESTDRMRKLLATHPELRGKIGSVLQAACGVCMDQAAAMVAILNAISRRAGLTARAASGPTIGQDEGHGFVLVRLANGALAMLDVAWHVLGDEHAVDNLDLATFDERWHSNRRINSLDQDVSAKTRFVPRTETGAALANERGFERPAVKTRGFLDLVDRRSDASADEER